MSGCHRTPKLKDAAELPKAADRRSGCRPFRSNAVLATGPRCAMPGAMADIRLPGRWRPTAGSWQRDPISTVFLHPWQVIPDEIIKPLQDAARAGNSSLYVVASIRGSPWRPGMMALAGLWHPRGRSRAARSSATPPMTRRRSHVRRDGLRPSRWTRSRCCFAARCAQPGLGISGPTTCCGPWHFT